MAKELRKPRPGDMYCSHDHSSFEYAWSHALYIFANDDALHTGRHVPARIRLDEHNVIFVILKEHMNNSKKNNQSKDFYNVFMTICEKKSSTVESYECKITSFELNHCINDLKIITLVAHTQND